MVYVAQRSWRYGASSKAIGESDVKVTASGLIQLIQDVINRKKGPSDRGIKSVIDSAYTTGAPKTARAEDAGVAAGKTKKVLQSAYHSPIIAGAEVLEVPVGDDTAIAGVLGTPPDMSNSYLLLPELPAGTTVTTAGVGSVNQVRCYRFVCKAPVRFNRFVYEIAAGVGRQSVGVARYSGDGNTRLATTGGQLNAGGLTNLSVTAVQLQGGVPYWFAWTADDTNITWRCAALDTNLQAILAAQVTHIGTAANASSAGAPPTTLGAITSGNFAIPLVKLQS